MGLGSFFSGIGSAIASGISRIASSIGTGVTSFAKTAFKAATGIFSSVGKIGGFVGKVAGVASKLFTGIGSIVAGPLGPIVGQVVTNLIIAAISKAVEWLSKKVSVAEPEDTVEEIGYRIEEASKHDDWQSREMFDSFAEYHNYLKAQIPVVDRNKIEANRLAYMGLGLSALNGGLEEKFGIQIPVEFLIEVGRAKFDGKELGSLIEEFSAKGYDLTQFRKYLRGDLSGESSRLIETAILESLKKIYPEKSADDFAARLSAMKNSARDDVAVLKNFEPEVEALTTGAKNFKQILFDGVTKNVDVGEGK